MNEPLPTADYDVPQYRLTAETGMVHKAECRYVRGPSLDWPRWPGRNPRACSACLSDGLPAWERDPAYPGVGRILSPGGGHA